MISDATSADHLFAKTFDASWANPTGLVRAISQFGSVSMGMPSFAASGQQAGTAGLVRHWVRPFTKGETSAGGADLSGSKKELLLEESSR